MCLFDSVGLLDYTEYAVGIMWLLVEHVVD